MTIARTALRLLVVQALAGSADARPTIAGNLIFDSRLSPENPEALGDDVNPAVLVFTDGDEGDALSDQNGGPPFHRLIDLVFDIGMVVREKAAPDGYLIGYPDTDARLEASLDFLETQIWRYLSTSLDPLPILFQRLVRVRKHESHRHTEDDASVKLARRLVTFTCEMNDDDYPVLNSASGQPTGLDALPEPLRTVAKAMPTGSSGADTATTLAAQWTTFTAGPLAGVDITADIGTTKADDKTVKASAETDDEE